MNNQKTFLAAFGVVLTVALIILGVSFSSLNSQTNNSKKVVADIKFENAYDFKVRLKSTDGSTFKLSSLPAKITITFADKTTEVIEKDIITASGYERNYIPYVHTTDSTVEISRFFSDVDYFYEEYDKVQSVEIEVNGKKATFQNNRLNSKNPSLLEEDDSESYDD